MRFNASSGAKTGISEVEKSFKFYLFVSFLILHKPSNDDG